jgi:hypothetical protein
MAVAQPGQLLVDGRLGSIHDLQWRDNGGALLLSPQAGAVEFTPLGYLQVKVRGGCWGVETSGHCAAEQLREIEALRQRRVAACLLLLASSVRLSVHPPQGLDEPKLVFQVLPALLRGRQYDELPTTARTSSRHHLLAGAGSLASHPSWAVMGSLRRQASVEMCSSEATPRQARILRGLPLTRAPLSGWSATPQALSAAL